MPNNNDQNVLDQEKHPELTPEEDKTQRGGAPDNPTEPQVTPDKPDPERVKQVTAWLHDKRHPSRQDGPSWREGWRLSCTHAVTCLTRSGSGLSGVTCGSVGLSGAPPRWVLSSSGVSSGCFSWSRMFWSLLFGMAQPFRPWGGMPARSMSSGVTFVVSPHPGSPADSAPR